MCKATSSSTEIALCVLLVEILTYCDNLLGTKYHFVLNVLMGFEYLNINCYPNLISILFPVSSEQMIKD